MEVVSFFSCVVSLGFSVKKKKKDFFSLFCCNSLAPEAPDRERVLPVEVVVVHLHDLPPVPDDRADVAVADIEPRVGDHLPVDVKRAEDAEAVEGIAKERRVEAGGEGQRRRRQRPQESFLSSRHPALEREALPTVAVEVVLVPVGVAPARVHRQRVGRGVPVVVRVGGSFNMPDSSGQRDTDDQRVDLVVARGHGVQGHGARQVVGRNVDLVGGAVGLVALSRARVRARRQSGVIGISCRLALHGEDAHGRRRQTIPSEVSKLGVRAHREDAPLGRADLPRGDPPLDVRDLGDRDEVRRRVRPVGRQLAERRGDPPGGRAELGRVALPVPAAGHRVGAVGRRHERRRRARVELAEQRALLFGEGGGEGVGAVEKGLGGGLGGVERVCCGGGDGGGVGCCGGSGGLLEEEEEEKGRGRRRGGGRLRLGRRSTSVHVRISNFFFLLPRPRAKKVLCSLSSRVRMSLSDTSVGCREPERKPKTKEPPPLAVDARGAHPHRAARWLLTSTGGDLVNQG